MFAEVDGLPAEQDKEKNRVEDAAEFTRPAAAAPEAGAVIGPGAAEQVAAAFFLFNAAVLLLLYLLGLEGRGQPRFGSMGEALREINNSIIWPGCIVLTGWTARVADAAGKRHTGTRIWRAPAMGLLGTLLSTLLLDGLLLIFEPVYRLAGSAVSLQGFFTGAFFGRLMLSSLCIGLLSLLPLYLHQRAGSGTLVLAASLIAAVLWATQFGLEAKPVWVDCTRAAMAAACLPLGIAAGLDRKPQKGGKG
ncbi:hypothetical protein [Paenibacillus glufosinatiresistens]|uniref:hypothetical protein n=1 Tax=Paenibacillus glufosinatiresistens TaxID=3070657 RepID=UPI00286D7CE0|nr:hypothetical protein [Paenibacillus sp. YX.27]